jgi:hypothetical protein
MRLSRKTRAIKNIGFKHGNKQLFAIITVQKVFFIYHLNFLTFYAI